MPMAWRVPPLDAVGVEAVARLADGEEGADAHEGHRTPHHRLEGAGRPFASEPAPHGVAPGEADGEDEEGSDEVDDSDPNVGGVLEPPRRRLDVLEVIGHHHHDDGEATELVDGGVAGPWGCRRVGRESQGAHGPDCTSPGRLAMVGEAGRKAWTSSAAPTPLRGWR